VGELEALGVKTIPPDLPSNMAEIGGDRSNMAEIGGDRSNPDEIGGDRSNLAEVGGDRGGGGSAGAEGALETAPEVAITRTRLLEMRTMPERGGYTPLLAAIEYAPLRFRRFR